MKGALFTGELFGEILTSHFYLSFSACLIVFMKKDTYHNSTLIKGDELSYMSVFSQFT